MGIKKNPGKHLKKHKGYVIFEERTFNANGVITKTNLCVLKGRKKLKQGCKNVAEAETFIDTLFA